LDTVYDNRIEISKIPTTPCVKVTNSLFVLLLKNEKAYKLSIGVDVKVKVTLYPSSVLVSLGIRKKVWNLGLS